jgi:hypothetical protein
MGQDVGRIDPAAGGVGVGSSTESSSDEGAQSDPVTRPTSTLATPVLWQILLMIPPPTG